MSKKTKSALYLGTQNKLTWVPGALTLLFLVLLTWTSIGVAQLPLPVSTQFDITGFLQEATLATAGDAHSGGTLRVNGHLITVPRETIVIFPANALTWQEVFVQAPAPYTNVATGMAMTDLPTPLTQYGVEVVGNRVGDTYIAGLIYISQQGLNSGQGFINFIDYSIGEMRVGGVIGDRTTGNRLRINDPTGKFGRLMSPDMRFTLDPDNPTIMSGTGFPMCFPRTDPAVVDDPLCPQGNRPSDLNGNFVGKFFMNDPGAAPGVPPDATKQAPFEVGDYVTFAGTLVTDNAAAPTAGPWPANGTAGTYISAHTITNNTAIFTMPGTNPAYVETDVFILGTGGLTVLGGAEATIRTRFEGMTTDPSKIIHLYGMDIDPLTGAETDRDWGTIGVDPGPPAGAVLGRWRFRPPCLPFGSAPAKPDKQCVMNQADTFLPPTREMRAVIEADWFPGQTTTSANGLIYGQYHAPITGYIFPENIPGSPVVPNNFEALPFLACGGYTSSAGTRATQLNPWPGAVAPACATLTPPVANAGPNQTVASGAPVTLNGGASTGTAPLTFSWLQAAADIPQVLLTGAGTASPTFTAPVVAATTVLNFTLTVTNSAGSSSASMTVTVNPPAPPVITSATANNTQVASNGTVTLSAVATGATPITFLWAQTVGPAGTFTPAPPAAASVTWTAPPVSLATTATFQVTATNAVGTSAPVSVSITINPVGAPTVAPIAAQTVLVGTAVTIPVTATSPNTKAKFTLSVTPTALTNFKVNGPSQTCTATGCTATFTVTFTAPTTAQVINFSITATDTSVTPNLTSAPQATTVTVNSVPTPTVNAVAPQTVLSGASVTIPVTATSPTATANLTLSAVQTTTFTLTGFSVSKTGQTCIATGCTFTFSVQFKAPTLPVGQVLPDVINFTITATDISVTPNLTSAPQTTSVTVNPVPDSVTITSAVYRRGKQRLTINATSSVISPNVVLKLQPFVTATGVIYNPDPAAGGVGNTFTNNGGGLYIIDLVGIPEPAVPPAKPLVVKSNLGGTSIPSALTLIRQ